MVAAPSLSSLMVSTRVASVKIAGSSLTPPMLNKLLMRIFCVDFPEEKLHQLMSELRTDGFEPYLTSVGGSGVGVLSPYTSSANPSAYDTLVTPPETPNVCAEAEEGSLATAPLRAAFVDKPTVEFGSWATDLGRWLYV